ncbi:MAG TPA: AMP-binding protein, partial [Candidatus Binataceae bacterium]
MLTDERRRLTAAEVVGEAGWFAASLEKHGVARGDRIVIQLPNCVEFACLLIACLEAGAIPIMALPALRRGELEYLVSFSGAKALAIAPEYRGFDHAALA